MGWRNGEGGGEEGDIVVRSCALVGNNVSLRSHLLFSSLYTLSLNLIHSTHTHTHTHTHIQHFMTIQQPCLTYTDLPQPHIPQRAQYQQASRGLLLFFFLLLLLLLSLLLLLTTPSHPLGFLRLC